MDSYRVTTVYKFSGRVGGNVEFLHPAGIDMGANLVFYMRVIVAIKIIAFYCCL